MAAPRRPLALLLKDADGGEEYVEALHHVGCDTAFVPVLSFAPWQCDALDDVSVVRLDPPAVGPPPLPTVRAMVVVA